MQDEKKLDSVEKKEELTRTSTYANIRDDTQQVHKIYEFIVHLCRLHRAVMDGQ